MKSIFSYIVIFFLLSSCATKKTITSDSSVAIDFIELGYGICSIKTTATKTMDNAPSGMRNVSTDFKIVEKTNTIPCKKGEQFGVNYLLKSDTYKNLPIEFVWTFPKTITNDKGNIFKEFRYKNFVATNNSQHEAYSLNKPYLIVKGEWKYQMFYEGKKIYEKRFYLE